MPKLPQHPRPQRSKRRRRPQPLARRPPPIASELLSVLELTFDPAAALAPAAEAPDPAPAALEPQVATAPEAAPAALGPAPAAITPADATLTPGWTQAGNCEWMIDAAGKLTVRPLGNGTSGNLGANSGSGKQAVPWYDQRESITSAVIMPGVYTT